MLRFFKKVWVRLPIDGSGAILICAPRQRLFQRVAARGFWIRMPLGTRLIARLAARILWFLACPVKAAMALRTDSDTPVGLGHAVWAGWTLGKTPQESIEWNGMARGDANRLELLRGIPATRCGTLLMAALGSPAETKLASDKLAMAERLAVEGLPVAVTCAVIERGHIPDTSSALWRGTGKLVIKPRHGTASRGLSAVVPLPDGRFAVDGGTLGSVELAQLLARRARQDDLLVQPLVAPTPETRNLSPNAPIAIRAFVMRRQPGDQAALLSAFLKIPPPGADVPRGTIELLVVPVTIETGVLEDGILFDRPRERWSRMPWHDAPVRGRRISDWPAVVRIAEQASEIMPNTPLIGWDILLGSDGPVVLEANTGVSLFRAALWHFEHGLQSPLFAVLEDWCRRQKR